MCFTGADAALSPLTGVAGQTIMGLAGHVSQRMLSHYSHVRRQSNSHKTAVLLRDDFHVIPLR